MDFSSPIKVGIKSCKNQEMYNEIFDIDFIMAAKPKYNPKSEIKLLFKILDGRRQGF